MLVVVRRKSHVFTIHESVLASVATFKAVKVSYFLQFLIVDLYSRTTSITEGRCFLPTKINTLSLNLPYMTMMFWPNLSELDSEIALFTIMPF